MCTQTTDPRSAIGYDPVENGSSSVRAPWTCTDMDTMAVAFHDGRACVASDPSVGVKIKSPGGATLSADFVPPQ
jgi:hypothetical protein